MSSKNKNRSRRRKSSRSSSQYQSLEARNLLAGVFHDSGTQELFVFGDRSDNSATVETSGANIEVTSDAGNHSFPSSEVSEIIFLGYGGDDNFTNNTSTPARLLGHAGNDTLTGGSAADVIVGGTGNDVMIGNDGNDRMIGAAGIDTIRGGDGNDSIFGGPGMNELHGDAGNDQIFGGDDVDKIFGGDGIDGIYALAGDDILDSGTGGVAGSAGVAQADLVLGLAGNDTFVGGGGLDIFWGGDGNDTMIGGDGENRIHGQNGNDSITGGPMADFLRGIDGNDTIDGGGGADFIDFGSGGNDVAVFPNDYSTYSVSSTNRGRTAMVDNGSLALELSAAEFIQFADRTIDSDQRTLAPVERFSLFELNNERESRNLQILSHPGDLTAYAENWAKDMSVNGLRHSSEADLRKLLVNGRTTFGENIIFLGDSGETDAEAAAEMHDLWMNSPTHKKNMVKGAYSELGVGFFHDGTGWWGVHVFYG